MLFLLATQTSHLALFTAVMALGLMIGIFGHIMHSRAMILTGILIIGTVSAYFSFVLQPSTG